MSVDASNKSLQNAWFSNYMPAPSTNTSVTEALSNVQTFANEAFTRLDKNGNNFIELSELDDILESGTLTEREISFVHFLINNYEQICDSFEEETKVDGISRQDLQAYFDLILNLL